MASLTIGALLELWLADLRANDLAPDIVRRYKSCSGYLGYPFKKLAVLALLGPILDTIHSQGE